jgi:hypothetical protein
MNDQIPEKIRRQNAEVAERLIELALEVEDDDEELAEELNGLASKVEHGGVSDSSEPQSADDLPAVDDVSYTVDVSTAVFENGARIRYRRTESGAIAEELFSSDAGDEPTECSEVVGPDETGNTGWLLEALLNQYTGESPQILNFRQEYSVICE